MAVEILAPGGLEGSLVDLDVVSPNLS
jgi:hypothetical protein